MLNQPIRQMTDDCKKIKKFFTDLIGAIYFFFENYRKRYPYILEGEKFNSNLNETILLYRVAGKRHVYEMSARKICNIKNLIRGFHPLDVRTISFIAGVELILHEPHERRIAKFNELKKRIFDNNFLSNPE